MRVSYSLSLSYRIGNIASNASIALALYHWLCWHCGRNERAAEQASVGYSSAQAAVGTSTGGRAARTEQESVADAWQQPGDCVKHSSNNDDNQQQHNATTATFSDKPIAVFAATADFRHVPLLHRHNDDGRDVSYHDNTIVRPHAPTDRFVLLFNPTKHKRHTHTHTTFVANSNQPQRVPTYVQAPCITLFIFL